MTELGHKTRPTREHTPGLKNQIRFQIQRGLAKIGQLLQDIKDTRKAHTIINFSHSQADDEFSSQLIWKQDSKHDYIFGPYDSSPHMLAKGCEIVITIECRNNWIGRYVGRAGVAVYGTVDEQRVRVLQENYGIITITKGSLEGQLTNSMSCEVSEMKLQQFYAFNREVQIQFTANKFVYSFADSLVKTIVEPKPDQEKRIFIMQVYSDGKQSQAIRRLLIFKSQVSETSPTHSKLYVAYEGFYEGHDFVQPVELPPGDYIFMTFQHTHLRIYVAQERQFQVVESKHRSQIKQLNLLLQGFQKDDPYRTAGEFSRTCDLNKGIVIETYRNMYQNEIYFQDTQGKTQQQDKRLMFKSLYSKRYQNHRLKSGETVVLFYEITRKPAVLYQPQKKVIVDRNQDLKARTVHEILK